MRGVKPPSQPWQGRILIVEPHLHKIYTYYIRKKGKNQPLFYKKGKNPLAEQVEEDVKYPYVLVHGLGGWGEGDGVNDTVQYWGATSMNLVSMTATSFTVSGATYCNCRSTIGAVYPFM